MYDDTCFLIGHHIVHEDIDERLRVAIRMHIEQRCVRTFVVGMHGAFDAKTARILCEVKRDYAQIRLCGLLSDQVEVYTR